MTQTHTPGPWRTVDKTRIEAEGFGLIAALRGESSPHYDTELDANAHLIAAAPDLLEAAEAIESALDGVVCDYEPQIMALRAAIAKARGQA